MRDRPLDQQLELLAIALLTVAAAAIRSRGFSSLGLFRDDAWVALSARAGIGTAWHMWVTAPGFFFLERTFIQIGPSATWWDQLPPFAASVLSIPMVYAVVRYFRSGRVASVGAAVLVAVSPISVMYATRVKEYSLDFLLTCILLLVAERARRLRGRRELTACAVVSVVVFLLSASTAVVIVAVWVVLGLSGLKDRSVRTTVVVLGAAATAGCAAVAGIFYTQISSALNRFWSENGGFIQHGSASQFVNSLYHTAWNLLSGVFGFSSYVTGIQVLILVVWLGLSIAAVCGNAALAIPGVAVLLAFVGCAVQVLPLGTGRTDIYLYPVVLLLPLAGAVRIWGALPRSAGEMFSDVGQPAAVGVAVVGLALSVVLIGRQVRDAPSYPGEAVGQLAAAIRHDERPGDHIYVNEVMRYPWALYESNPLKIKLGKNWGTGFTVVSSDPGVFIDPSENYEGDQHPVQWAKQMNRYQRVWYVWSPPLSVFSFSYGALVGDGWHVVQTITAPGCDAYLLVRKT